ncbi:hypothetical protein K438DRAFT_1929571 [Mycena galopus ATCC 62051]|nr:hypothetical protein K438DRAFT_1929571 [Mycena galopus ATCC 62051]
MSVGKCRLVKVDRPRPNEVDLGMFLLPCLHSDIGMQGCVLKESSGATWLTSFVVSLWQGSITDEYLQVDPWTEERAGFDDQANGRRRDSTVESRGVPWTPPSNLIPILSNFWNLARARRSNFEVISVLRKTSGMGRCSCGFKDDEVHLGGSPSAKTVLNTSSRKTSTSSFKFLQFGCCRENLRSRKVDPEQAAAGGYVDELACWPQVLLNSPRRNLRFGNILSFALERLLAFQRYLWCTISLSYPHPPALNNSVVHGGFLPSLEPGGSGGFKSSRRPATWGTFLWSG